MCLSRRLRSAVQHNFSTVAEIWSAFCAKSKRNTGETDASLTKAERGGFEPPVPFPAHSSSSAAQSATLSPLRAIGTGKYLYAACVVQAALDTDSG